MATRAISIVWEAIPPALCRVDTIDSRPVQLNQLPSPVDIYLWHFQINHGGQERGPAEYMSFSPRSGHWCPQGISPRRIIDTESAPARTLSCRLPHLRKHGDWASNHFILGQTCTSLQAAESVPPPQGGKVTMSSVDMAQGPHHLLDASFYARGLIPPLYFLCI